MNPPALGAAAAADVAGALNLDSSDALTCGVAEVQPASRTVPATKAIAALTVTEDVGAGHSRQAFLHMLCRSDTSGMPGPPSRLLSDVRPRTPLEHP